MSRIPKRVPGVAYVGTLLEFKRRYPGFNPETDTAVCHFRSSTGYLDIPATASEGYYLFSDPDFDADVSGEYFDGDTAYFIVITKDGQENTVEQGNIEIRQDPTAAEATDFRSDNEKILDAITAVLMGNAGEDVLSYTISTNAGSRTLSKVPRPELLAMEREFKARVRSERQADQRRSGRKSGNLVKSRMSRRG